MIAVLSFLATLTILIFIHELGHFLAARSVGVKVLTFSIGLPPKIFTKVINSTEYCLSLLPLGGYVEILGQSEATADKTDPQNYASKTKLQQAWIIIAGPLFNLLFAFIAFSIAYQIGSKQPAYLFSKPVLGAIQATTLAGKLGLQEADTILSINKKKVATWEEAFPLLANLKIKNKPYTITVQRKTEQKTILVPNLKKDQFLDIQPAIPPIIGEVLPDSPASKAGLQKNDKITQIDGVTITYWNSMTNLIQANTNEDVTLTIIRNNKTIQVKITPEIQNKRKIIGIILPTIQVKEPIGKAIKKGFTNTLLTVQFVIHFIQHALTHGVKQDELAGPIRIAVTVGHAAKQGVSVWLFTLALISLQLAIFNLLPIPALDGGHLFILLIEFVIRRDIPIQWKTKIQYLGMSLLLIIIMYVIFNDIHSLFR